VQPFVARPEQRSLALGQGYVEAVVDLLVVPVGYLESPFYKGTGWVQRVSKRQQALDARSRLGFRHPAAPHRAELPAAYTRDARTEADPVYELWPLAVAFRGMGMAYAMQGKDAQALQAYEKYLKFAPAASDKGDIRRSIAELKARARIGTGDK